MSNLLIYGAYGYTGELISRRSVDQGLRPVLAGRKESPLRQLAEELDLEYRTFSLDTPHKIDVALADVAAVLHCAGPFLYTAGQMADACLRTQTHYLDITGEIDIFEGLAARDAEARTAGVVMMPGVGFDVVPTDCLASYLKEQLPSARSLELAFSSYGGVSRGTAKTSIERLGTGGAVRRRGQIVAVPAAWKTATIPFRGGEREAVTIPWGDVATAFHTTGIENITVYATVPRQMHKAMLWSRRLPWLFRSRWLRGRLKSKIDQRPPGPNAEARATHTVELWGGVTDGERSVEAQMTTPEGYRLTSETAVEAARRVADGQVSSGFQTPAGAFGADFVLQFKGVQRHDVTHTER